MKKSPPSIPRFLLCLIRDKTNHESLIGDYEEIFHYFGTTYGYGKARIWYWGQVFKALPFFISNSIRWRLVMFNNYLKIALRNIKRHKGYSFINIAGLAIGMACFILLMLYVKYELSFDKFHKKSDRIYRTIMDLPTGNYRGLTEWAITTAMLAPTLMEEFPDVEYATRLYNCRGRQLRYKEKNFVGDGKYGDEHFLKVFSFNLIKGSESSALTEPFSLVLSEKLTEKFFGNDNPIGKVITVNNRREYTVTGIIENVPDNSHLQFDFIISFSSLKASGRAHVERWTDINFSTYLLLNDGVSYKEFEKKLDSIVNKYHAYTSEETKRRYFLQPLKDIHLRSHYISDIAENNGDIKLIYLLISIAVVILLMACINYMNLATARAAWRSKEIGIRKAIGAKRMQLIHQTLSESILLTVLSLTSSLVIVGIFLPSFSAFVDRNIGIDLLLGWKDVFILLGMFFAVGLLSGSYPAYFLSSFRPVNILKNTIKSRAGKNPFNLRNILVVFQCGISIVLILSSLVIQKQLMHIKNSDIGFKRENIAVVRVPWWHNIREEKCGVIKEELLQNSSIKCISVSSSTPLAIGNEDHVTIETENAGEMIDIPQSSRAYVDYDYMDLYNIKILQGRNFSPSFITDKEQSVIVNETLVKQAGLKNPIGKKLTRPDLENGRIIGVVKDFHFLSFKAKIEPVIFSSLSDRGQLFSIEILPGNMEKTLNSIQTAFQKHINNYLFNYYFLDDNFNDMYKAEEKLGKILISFAFIAIIIACLGLFGLASFVTERRTKEIGIRKVVGASISNIMTLLVKEFFMLVCVSIVIALPFAFYMMNKWLDNYVYKTSISVWILLLSTSIALSSTLFTVCFHAAKAATTNPADSLRYE